MVFFFFEFEVKKILVCLKSNFLAKHQQRGWLAETSITDVYFLQSGRELCSIHCPLAVGQVPSLQCSLCLCLYHVACQGQPQHQNVSFVCKVGYVTEHVPSIPLLIFYCTYQSFGKLVGQITYYHVNPCTVQLIRSDIRPAWLTLNILI